MVNKPFDYKTWCRKSSYHIPGCVIGHDKESPALKHFWQSWSKNILFNKERINSLPALNELYDPGWADEPCLVVAGGPSAYERMDDIGKAQAAGWRIVAVDKIYGALRAHGIRPDMTISLDSQDIVAEWFDGVPIDKTDKFGVCITSSLKTYDALDGGSVYPFAVVKSNKDFENVILQYFGRKYFSVRAGAIVTFDAVEFALWMGCDPIVTIGNELSYERIQDVPKRNSIKKEQGRYTIPAFNTANVMFYIIDKLHPEVKKLDASGGIMNWEKVTLEEALLTYSPIMIGANNEKNTCNDMLNACCADGKSKCGNASMSR